MRWLILILASITTGAITSGLKHLSFTKFEQLRDNPIILVIQFAIIVVVTVVMANLLFARTDIKK